MIKITSIEKGIVIDHITAGLGIEIFKYLKLDNANFSVALIMNVNSKKQGKKDMIKIDNIIEFDVTELGLIDPNVTIITIENGEIIRKSKLTLPAQVENVIKCKNPRCVTSVEKYVDHVFYLVDEEKREYRCKYCDEKTVFKGV